MIFLICFDKLSLFLTFLFLTLEDSLNTIFTNDFVFIFFIISITIYLISEQYKSLTRIIAKTLQNCIKYLDKFFVNNLTIFLTLKYKF